MQNTDQIYSPRELSKLYKVPLRLVLKAIREKELAAARFSSSTLRIRADEAARWFNSKTKKP